MYSSLERIGLFNKSKKIIFGFIIINFIADFIDKLSIFYGLEIFKFNRFIKAIFLVYCISFIVLNFKYAHAKARPFLYVFVSVTIIFSLKYGNYSQYIHEYVKYIFLALIYPLLQFTFFEQNKEPLRIIHKILRGFIFINALAIAMGMLFKINVFNTYQGGRFGYNGLILSQGMTPYIYLTASVLMWYFKDKILLVFVVICAILSGVKGVYFSQFMFFGILVLLNKNYSNITKAKGLSALLVLFIVLLIVFLKNTLFFNLIKEEGFITALFSFRIDNLNEIINAINQDNYNVLYGTISLIKFKVEMQIADIVLFFGILGLIVYVFITYRFYLLSKQHTITKAYFFSVITLAILSGNLYYNPQVCLFFAITLLSFKTQSLARQSFD